MRSCCRLRHEVGRAAILSWKFESVVLINASPVVTQTNILSRTEVTNGELLEFKNYLRSIFDI